VALEVRADNAELPRFVVGGQQREGIRAEARSTPWAVLQGDRRRLALGIGLELPRFGARGVRAPVPLLPEDVGRRRLPHPETDLEGPLPVPRDVPFPLELQCTYEPGGAPELIEREQPQRIAHDYGHPGGRKPVPSRMT